MRYWNWEMLATLNSPGGSKGKMKLGVSEGSSAQVAVPPVIGVPPVGTVVPLAWPPDAEGVGEDEHAAKSNAAAVAIGGDGDHCPGASHRVSFIRHRPSPAE